MLRAFHVFVLASGLVVPCPASQFDTDTAKLLRNVPREFARIAQARRCSSPAVTLQRADFERTRIFPYIVASYMLQCGSHVWSTLRLLQQKDDGLLLKGVLSGPSLRVDEKFVPWVEDLDNDGIPEIVIREYRAVDNYSTATIEVFRWVEGQLVSIPTDGVDTTDGTLRDTNADGKWELIGSPSCPIAEGLEPPTPLPAPVEGLTLVSDWCPKTKVYFYESGRFTESAERRRGVWFDHTVVRNRQFPFGEISKQQAPSSPANFTVQLGRSYGGEKLPPVSEIDRDSLLLARALRPTAIRIRRESQDDDCARQKQQPHTFQDSWTVECFIGDFLEATFSRDEVAKLLPSLELTRNLEVGDYILVPIAARMKNGDYVSQTVAVSITRK